jgi:phosphate transport system protein
VLKVNNDLERMGDFAVNIARRAIFLGEHEKVSFPPEFTQVIANSIQTMVRYSLESLVQLDVEMTHKVIAMIVRSTK